MEKSDRQIAYEILLRIEMDAAYSTLSLQEALGRSAADVRGKSLVTTLVYGVVERKLTLDHELQLYLTKPLKKLSPQVLTVLRLGAYQLRFTEKIPVSAAVNESVKLAKANGCAYAAGLVNAVLRKLAARPFAVPADAEPLTRLTLQYSIPKELASLFVARFGEEKTAAAFEAFCAPRPLFIRVNTLKTDVSALQARLEELGAEVFPAGLPDALRVAGLGDLAACAPFREGLFHVQDLSSQLCVHLLDPQPGETLVDCCAAPGGKTFTCAERMDDRGDVLACDIFPHKTALIERGAVRLGLTCVRTVCADAATLGERGLVADRVLCDAPCSGLGVIGRKPELKYKPLSDFEALPALQARLLDSAASMVRPGGTLVYSTCTLRREENEDVCAAFLERRPEFRYSAFAPYRARCGGGDTVTVLPGEGEGDGFFIARFEREVSA